MNSEINLDFLQPYENESMPGSEKLGLNEYLDAAQYCIEHLKPQHVLEIGFNYGSFAAMLLEMDKDLKLTSVDLTQFECTRLSSEMFKQRYKDRFQFIQDDSRNILNYKLPQFDFAFIDGNHLPEYVIRDIMSCRSLKCAHILLDDVHEEINKSNYNLNTNVKGTDWCNHNGVSIAVAHAKARGWIVELKRWHIPVTDAQVILFSVS